MPKRYRKHKTKQSLVKYGYKFRSLLELRVADWLTALDVPWEYEKDQIQYFQPARGNGRCNECGSKNVGNIRNYLPDFEVQLKENWTVFLEAKGEFKSTDRTKHINLRNSHPEMDLRFIFQSNNWLDNKTKAHKYDWWCEHNGFDYTLWKNISKDWLFRKEQPPKN